MPEAYSNTSGQSLASIERPRCPKCQTRMSLARIAPGPKGFDQRTFECGKCEHIHKEVIFADPMKSSKTGWLDGADLKAPK